MSFREKIIQQRFLREGLQSLEGHAAGGPVRYHVEPLSDQLSRLLDGACVELVDVLWGEPTAHRPSRMKPFFTHIPLLSPGAGFPVDPINAKTRRAEGRSR